MFYVLNVFPRMDNVFFVLVDSVDFLQIISQEIFSG